MITRLLYYFRKKVLAADVLLLQGSIEDGIDRVPAERGMYGLTVPTHTVVPGAGFNISIDSGGADPLVGYNSLGQRVALDVNPKVVDLSALFTLPGVGNEKWLTVYMRAIKVGSQTETEKKPPVFTQVDFVQTEGFEIVVVEGVEAPVPVKPALAAGDVFLVDIKVPTAVADFTTSTFELDRKRVEPLAEATSRGMDGNVNKVVLTQENNDLLRFRDLLGSNTDLDEGLIATIIAGITGANRPALLSELNIKGVLAISSLQVDSAAAVTSPMAAIAIPAGVKVAVIAASISEAGSRENAVWLFDVAANSIQGMQGYVLNGLFTASPDSGFTEQGQPLSGATLVGLVSSGALLSTTFTASPGTFHWNLNKVAGLISNVRGKAIFLG